MYKKLKEVLETKGQQEGEKFFLKINGDREIAYHKDLDILTITEHCCEKVRTKRDPSYLSYEEQIELFEELGIKPNHLLDKLKLYVNAKGTETPDGLYINLNLEPIPFTDLLGRSMKAMSLSYLIRCDQLETIVINTPGQVRHVFGKGTVGEPGEPEHWYWRSVLPEVRDAIADQLGLKGSEEEERVANLIQKYRDIITTYVKERGKNRKEGGLYLPLGRTVGYRDNPFTIQNGNWVPSNIIFGVVLIEDHPTMPLSFECHYNLDPEDNLDSDVHYLSFDAVRSIRTLREIIWVIENK